MRQRTKRKTITPLWILCIICAVLLGICFDNVQADSCLAYQNIASNGMGEVDTSVLCSTQKDIAAQQAYVPENFGQGSYALTPRKTSQRTNSRSAFGYASCVLFVAIFLSALFFGRMLSFSDGLCEVISNTIILRYIHGQDGEKA